MDQHSCVVNDAALAKLDTTPIEGGEIEREHGIFREQAAWKRVIPAIPTPSLAAKRASLAKACAHLHALGIASVGSMEYLCDIRDVFVPARNALTLRVHATVLDRAWPLDQPPELPQETSDFFRIVGLKSFPMAHSDRAPHGCSIRIATSPTPAAFQWSTRCAAN